MTIGHKYCSVFSSPFNRIALDKENYGQIQSPDEIRIDGVLIDANLPPAPPGGGGFLYSQRLKSYESVYIRLTDVLHCDTM